MTIPFNHAPELIAAWIDQRLPPPLADELGAAIAKPGPWQDAYRAEMARWTSLASVVRSPWDPNELTDTSEDQHAVPALTVPLPHMGGSFRVWKHRDGWRVSGPGATQDLPHGTTSITWGDDTLGAMHTELRSESASRRLRLEIAANTANQLVYHPHAGRAMELVQALGIEFREALAEAASRVGEGAIGTRIVPGRVAAAGLQHREVTVAEFSLEALLVPAMPEHRAQASTEELTDAAAAVLMVRLRIDRVLAELSDLDLFAALADADAACAPFAHGLLLLERDRVDRLMLPDDVLDPNIWWGIHARLDAAMTDEEVDAMLLGDS